jgi:LysW-gamma-L-lysine carboxypeptidase
LDAQRLLREMLDIASPSGGEAALAEHLVRRLHSGPLRCHLDGVGNLVAETGRAPGPLILLLGHLDTAGSGGGVRQVGRRLYGPGAVDAKGPLAAFLCAAQRLADVPARLRVIGAVEEETPGSRGAAHLLAGDRPDAIVIGEPSGWSGVTLGYKGMVELRYEVTRPSCHTASPEERAPEVAVSFWTDLLRRCDPSGGFGVLTAALHTVSATLTTATLGITCRIPPGADAAELVASLAPSLRGGTLTTVAAIPAVVTRRGNPVARALTEGVRAQGGQVTPKLKTGTSDMNIVAAAWGVDAIAAYGPGDSKLDHSPDEHIDLDEYLRAIDVLTVAVPSLVRQLTADQSARGQRVVVRVSP